MYTYVYFLFLDLCFQYDLMWVEFHWGIFTEKFFIYISGSRNESPINNYLCE